MGNITRIINDQSHWISENDFDIISKINDISFSSVKKVSIDGQENGHEIGTYNYHQENDDEKDFPFGWWSKDYKGKIRSDAFNEDGSGFKANLEDTVYFQLDVNDKIPIDTKMEFNLWDYDSGGLGVLFFLPWDQANPDDDEFGEEGKEQEIKKYSIVRDVDGKKRITLKLFLNPDWKKQLDEDKTFNDNFLDFYWKWTYNNIEWNSEAILLKVTQNRNLYIQSANSKYPLPQIIDGKTGEFIIFLKNEGSGLTGLFEADIQHFFAIKVKILVKYEFEEGKNKTIKTLYENTYNLRTGESSHQKIYSITESADIRFKNTGTQVYIEGVKINKIQKKFADYYNIKDIGKYGVKGIHYGMEVLGYLDFVSDLKDLASGKKLAMYDMVGIATQTGEIAERVTSGLKKGLELPKAVNAILFGLALYEATVCKDAMDRIEEMFEEVAFEHMENAKRKGLQEVRSLLYAKIMQGYYELAENISQEKHNQVFLGKLRTRKELKEGNSANPNITKYTYLLKISKDEDDLENYVIDSIFINV